MNLKSIVFTGILTSMSAVAVCVMLAPNPADASTCMLRKGKWVCGGATLADAKSACNVTTGNLPHTCDAGINVCHCATSSQPSSGGNMTKLVAPGAGGTPAVKAAQ
ncbi:MAG: hypothetical protein ACFB13_03240 [Kiloniellaceae bacterium]